MTTEIANTPDGLGLNVRVCEDGICKTGFTSSMHLVEKKAHELKAAIRREAADAFKEIMFKEISALEAAAMTYDDPLS